MNGHEHVLAQPEAWGMALGTIGRVLVWFGVLGSWGAALLWGLSGRNPRFLKIAKPLFIAAASACFLSFLILVVLAVRDQFQFKYIFGHSRSDYELQYKIASAWAGQEGSILLWTICSALFSVLALRVAGEYERWFGLLVAVVQGALTGILAFESPFALNILEGMAVLPPDGRGMSNALLNYWVVIHPPTIFLGFGSLTAIMAFGGAAMLSRNLDGWILRVRSLSLVSLAILGLGLCMGGFWAYETLGWGGFWMWDPVENTSFVPWCALAAFVHGIFIQSVRKKGQMTNIALAGAPYLLFVYGTFMTRSGFLGDTSVHSFAKMNSVALWLLITLMGVSLLGYGFLWFRTLVWWNNQPHEVRPLEQNWFNRTNFYQIAMWLLFGFGLCTAIGMSVPLIQSALSQTQKVVEEKVYHQILFWLYIPIMLGVAIAPFLTWKGLRGRQLMQKITNPLAVAVFLTGMLMLWAKNGWAGRAFDPTAENAVIHLVGGLSAPRLQWTAFLTFFSIFALSANLWCLAEMARKSKRGIGGFITHIGLAVALCGLVVSRGLEQRSITKLSETSPGVALGKTYEFTGKTHEWTSRHNRVNLEVTTDGGKKFSADPGLYFTMGSDGEPAETIWPAIVRHPLYDDYVVLHKPVTEATDPVQLKEGEEARFEDMLITYRKLRTEGELGTIGAKFFADLTIETVAPTETISIGQSLDSDLTKTDAVLADGRKVTLDKWDEDTGAATFQISGVDGAVTMTPGTRTRKGGFVISCLGLKTQGSTLLLDLQVEPILNVQNVSPSITIGEGDLEREPVMVNDDYKISFAGMEASDKSAQLVFEYTKAVFPLDVYYKPLTWLVWLGVGIMTLGGLMSAAYRRITKRTTASAEETVEKEIHAIESTAQI